MPSDDELIQSFLRGDPAAVHTVDAWIESASWPFRQRLGEDLSDVLQDVRLEVTRLLRANEFRGEATLRTFLWQVTVHLCLDRIRAQTRWVWTDFDEVKIDLENRGLIPVEDPRFEVRDLIERVIAAASEECKRLWMLLVAGYSYEEMANLEGQAPGTLRVRVNRCRAKAIQFRDRLL